MKATREANASWIFRATVVLPEAVPPAIPRTRGAATSLPLSEVEFFAQFRDVHRQMAHLFLELGNEGRLQVVQQDLAAAAIELLQLLLDRLRREVARDVSQSLQLVGEAALEQQHFQVLHLVEDLPELLGGPRVSADRQRRAAIRDHVAARL